MSASCGGKNHEIDYDPRYGCDWQSMPPASRAWTRRNHANPQLCAVGYRYARQLRWLVCLEKMQKLESHLREGAASIFGMLRVNTVHVRMA